MAVDVRILSATWAPIEERAASGRFREDLLHRISTFVLRVPPLRGRKSDIPLLATGLLARLQDEVGRKELSTTALARLVEHSWPGNVRELGSVLYRAAVAAIGVDVDGRHVEAALAGLARTRPPALSTLEALAVLDEYQGNVSAAARASGVPRSTFRSWLAHTR